jgi:hypothetical protein
MGHETPRSITGALAAIHDRRLPSFVSRRAFTQMVPHTFPWQLVGVNAARGGSASMKTIVIQHVETLYFQSLPFFGVHPKPNRYTRHPKVQICQLG